MSRPMYTRTYRIITALEVTFWLTLLLLLGTVQSQHPVSNTTGLLSHPTRLVQQQNLAPRHPRRLPLPHRLIGGW